MIEVRPGVTQLDIDTIAAQPRPLEQRFFAAGGLPPCAKDVVAGGTLFVDGEPKVAAGIVKAPGGVGLAWLLSCVDFKPYVRHVYSALRRGVDQADTRGWKLIAFVETASPQAVRLLEHLGFAPVSGTDTRGYTMYRKD